jgi:hypothetical protein
MWKELALVVISTVALNACATPVNRYEAARQTGLNNTPLSRGACDGIGQLMASNLPESCLTLGPVPTRAIEASAAPTH